MIDLENSERSPRKHRESIPHGTQRRYQQGCSCADCKAAHAECYRMVRLEQRRTVMAKKLVAHAYSWPVCRCGARVPSPELWSQHLAQIMVTDRPHGPRKAADVV